MRGKYRHWKTGWNTTFTMLTSPEIFRTYWEFLKNLQFNIKNGMELEIKIIQYMREIQFLIFGQNTLQELIPFQV